VARLAAESVLALQLPGAVLELGHWKIVGPLLERIAWPADGRKALELALNRKSVPSLRELADRFGNSPELELLTGLVHLGGRPADVDKLLPTDPAWQSLRDLGAAVQKEFPSLLVRLEPTDVRHWAYYTGLTVKVFSPDHPSVVLSGGRYDGLYPTLGRPFGACGFAVHLGRLLEEAGCRASR
jgi:ATP phosphoribosyltransferase regulatory subunit HisZ